MCTTFLAMLCRFSYNTENVQNIKTSPRHFWGCIVFFFVLALSLNQSLFKPVISHQLQATLSHFGPTQLPYGKYIRNQKLQLQIKLKKKTIFCKFTFLQSCTSLISVCSERQTSLSLIPVVMRCLDSNQFGHSIKVSHISCSQ